MFVLITIALILVLLVVIKPADRIPSARSNDREDIRSASDLQALRR
jgi:hypothetical protein